MWMWVQNGELVIWVHARTSCLKHFHFQALGEAGAGSRGENTKAGGALKCGAKMVISPWDNVARASSFTWPVEEH